MRTLHNTLEKEQEIVGQANIIEPVNILESSEHVIELIKTLYEKIEAAIVQPALISNVQKIVQESMSSSDLTLLSSSDQEMLKRILINRFDPAAHIFMWCTCVNAGYRIQFIMILINTVLKKHAVDKKRLKYISMSSGMLLQDYLTVKELLYRGYNLNLTLIDPFNPKQAQLNFLEDQLKHIKNPTKRKKAEQELLKNWKIESDAIEAALKESEENPGEAYYNFIESKLGKEISPSGIIVIKEFGELLKADLGRKDTSSLWLSLSRDVQQFRSDCLVLKSNEKSSQDCIADIIVYVDSSLPLPENTNYLSKANTLKFFTSDPSLTTFSIIPELTVIFPPIIKPELYILKSMQSLAIKSFDDLLEAVKKVLTTLPKLNYQSRARKLHQVLESLHVNIDKKASVKNLYFFIIDGYTLYVSLAYDVYVAFLELIHEVATGDAVILWLDWDYDEKDAIIRRPTKNTILDPNTLPWRFNIINGGRSADIFMQLHY